MKKLKLILPMLAILFAIGLSFAFADMDAEANNDYILRNNQWEAIPEQDCGSGSLTCQVKVHGEGPFNVYDQENNLASLKKGNGTIKIIP